MIKEQQFCKILIAKDIKADKSVVLKSFKRMALQQQKEYHKNKNGPGMIMKTELSKVMDGELTIMKEMPVHKNVIELHEIIDNEEEDKLMAVIDYC